MLVTSEPDPLLVQMPAVLDAWHRQIDVVSDLVRNNIEALLSALFPLRVVDYFHPTR